MRSYSCKINITSVREQCVDEPPTQTTTCQSAPGLENWHARNGKFRLNDDFGLRIPASKDRFEGSQCKHATSHPQAQVRISVVKLCPNRCLIDPCLGAIVNTLVLQMLLTLWKI